MSWVSMYVHMVFSTKNRRPYLNDAIRQKVFHHIRENARAKGLWIDCANGYTDHAHCLVSLGREQSISKVAQMIKGESSAWINKEKLTSEKFIWQDDFWAVGVSQSHVARVRNYILRQEEHHRKQAFEKELAIFVRKYGWAVVSVYGNAQGIREIGPLTEVNGE